MPIVPAVSTDHRKNENFRCFAEGGVEFVSRFRMAVVRSLRVSCLATWLVAGSGHPRPFHCSGQKSIKEVERSEPDPGRRVLRVRDHWSVEPASRGRQTRAAALPLSRTV